MTIAYDDIEPTPPAEGEPQDDLQDRTEDTGPAVDGEELL